MATFGGWLAHAFLWLACMLRQLVASVLRARPIPKHVAFIMDGNRRFAERRHLQKAQGHTLGYQRLISALEWCLDLGVQCVSVYAFSIDNYHRSPEEVDTLMRLAEEKLGHMLQEQEVLRRHDVRVRVIGDMSLAPPSVQAAADRIMAATAHHTSAILNICFSYTSSREMQHALDVMATANATSTSRTLPTAPSIDDQLYTRGCPPVDLLVRTSGETRLSDFLLWQSRHALLVFTRVLWPDFTFVDLVAAVLQYQRSAPMLERLKLESSRAQAALGAAAAARKQSNERLRGPFFATTDGVPQRLPALKTSAEGSEGSPCSVGTPGWSSPTSGSEPSSEASDQPLPLEADLPLPVDDPEAPTLRHRMKQLQVQVDRGQRGLPALLDGRRSSSELL